MVLSFLSRSKYNTFAQVLGIGYVLSVTFISGAFGGISDVVLHPSISDARPIAVVQMVLYSWFFIVLLISFFYDLFDGYASRSNTSI